VLEGCRYAYNGGAPSGNVPAFFRVIGAGGFHGIPYNILIMAAIAAVFVVLLMYRHSGAACSWSAAIR